MVNRRTIPRVGQRVLPVPCAVTVKIANHGKTLTKCTRKCEMIPEPDAVAFLTRFGKEPAGDSGRPPKVGEDSTECGWPACPP